MQTAKKLSHFDSASEVNVVTADHTWKKVQNVLNGVLYFFTSKVAPYVNLRDTTVEDLETNCWMSLLNLVSRQWNWNYGISFQSWKMNQICERWEGS